MPVPKQMYYRDLNIFYFLKLYYIFVRTLNITHLKIIMKKLTIVFLIVNMLMIKAQHPYVTAITFADSIDVLNHPTELKAKYTKAFYIINLEENGFGHFNNPSILEGNTVTYTDLQEGFNMNIETITYVEGRDEFWKFSIKGYDKIKKSPLQICLSKGGNVMGLYHTDNNKNSRWIFFFTDKIQSELWYLMKYEKAFFDLQSQKPINHI